MIRNISTNFLIVIFKRNRKEIKKKTKTLEKLS